MATQKEKSLSIYDKLSAIQSEIKAPKSQFNKFGNYSYRSAEDVLEALKPYLVKYGVSLTIEEEVVYQGDEFNPPMIKCVCFFRDSGEYITSSSVVGVDLSSKGMSMPQRYGAASSYGRKYALGAILLLDDTKDADATNTHGKETKSPSKPKASSNGKPLTDAIVNNIKKAKGEGKTFEEVINILESKGFEKMEESEFKKL